MRTSSARLAVLLSKPKIEVIGGKEMIVTPIPRDVCAICERNEHTTCDCPKTQLKIETPSK